MPPDLLTRSAHHSVPRNPAAPTGAAMPARIARMPILTGSDGTPGLACARATAGNPTAPAAAAPPATLRNSRLVVAIVSSLVVELALQLLAGQLGTGRESLELLEGDPARHREESTIGNQGQALGGNVLEAETHPLRDLLGSLHVKRFHVNHAAGDVAIHPHVLPHIDLGHLTVGVLEDELLALRLEEGGEEPPI